MGKTLDAIDTQLLALLRSNGRTPLVTLAKKVGLSRSATQERIQRLESHGVIAAYTIVEGAQDGLTAWLLLRYQPGTRCADLVPRLRAIPQVRLCHSLAGQIDLLALAQADSQQALTAIRDQIASLPGVAEVTTAPVMKAHWNA